MELAFIGIGVMGSGMAANLLSAGHSLKVFTRTREKAKGIIDQGAIWCGDIKTCVAGAQAVITIVGYPKDVEEVYFGADGILKHAAPGTYLIDMTTSAPKLAERIDQAAREKGLFALDAPVSGGDTGARNGTLTIMAGGEKATFDACMPLFTAMGRNIRHTGPAGSGQHTKMANQIAIAGTIAGVCEAIVYARATGLHVPDTLATIGTGAAGSWQMANNGPKMAARDDQPGFYIKHFIKDMGLALQEAGERGQELPVLKLVEGMYAQLLAQGLGEKGTQALMNHYDEEMS